jgi:hypothetical protein
MEILSTQVEKQIKEDAIKNLPKKVLNRLLREFNLAIVKHIKDFSRQGRNPNGRRFKPYSKAYRKKVSGDVDLRRTGRMMNSLQPIIGRSKFVKKRDYISFRPVYGVKGDRNARIANYHVVQGAGKSKVKRDFLTLTNKTYLDRLFKRALKRVF